MTELVKPEPSAEDDVELVAAYLEASAKSLRRAEPLFKRRANRIGRQLRDSFWGTAKILANHDGAGDRALEEIQRKLLK